MSQMSRFVPLANFLGDRPLLRIADILPPDNPQLNPGYV